VKNQRVANNSTTTEATEKNNYRFGIVIILEKSRKISADLEFFEFKRKIDM
jgi:hypothetical protein